MEMVQGRTLVPGQRVRVYVNLHKQGRFSIVDLKTGLVCAYATSCLIEDATFHVSVTGREKVRREKRKMVHAWVRGVFKEGEGRKPTNLLTTVHYNPYENETFVSNGNSVTTSNQAYFENKQVYI